MFPVGTSVRIHRMPGVTLGLVATIGVAFLWETTLGERQLLHLLYGFGVVPAHQLQLMVDSPGEVERWLLPMLTSMFLHGGWIHAIGNAIFLWVFGPALEDRLGHARYLLFYLVCGVVASQAQVLAEPASTVPMIGASGAIAGVLGAYIISFPTAWVVVMIPIVIIPVFFELPAVLFLGVWFLEQLLAGAYSLTRAAGDTGGVAWWAHAGGFVTGFALLVLFTRGRLRGGRGDRQRERIGGFRRRYAPPRERW
ncbi:MAG: rhomboid family intramembrane serine protease [Myxococcota bacterium]